ncbi:hypothetical protein SDC9_83529 [bioreactor metagenome]|uniref:Uncharacterized protein n=1 Tax=bioreactor metagenome TaxID=1076179 RepID=A0A644Z7S4_9ZZZZ
MTGSVCDIAVDSRGRDSSFWAIFFQTSESLPCSRGSLPTGLRAVSILALLLFPALFIRSLIDSEVVVEDGATGVADSELVTATGLGSAGVVEVSFGEVSGFAVASFACSVDGALPWFCHVASLFRRHNLSKASSMCRRWFPLAL